jgi:hypothetical protein
LPKGTSWGLGKNLKYESNSKALKYLSDHVIRFSLAHNLQTFTTAIFYVIKIQRYIPYIDIGRPDINLATIDFIYW